MTSISCYHCGASLDGLTEPYRRLEECPACQRYLHVCLMCIYYDPRETSKQCREDDAEQVRDKAGANFCDYYKPRHDAFDPARLSAAESATRQLEGLFGQGDDAEAESGRSDHDRALQDAEALFRK